MKFSQENYLIDLIILNLSNVIIFHNVFPQSHSTEKHNVNIRIHWTSVVREQYTSAYIYMETLTVIICKSK